MLIFIWIKCKTKNRNNANYRRENILEEVSKNILQIREDYINIIVTFSNVSQEHVPCYFKISYFKAQNIYTFNFSEAITLSQSSLALNLIYEIYQWKIFSPDFTKQKTL